MATEISLDETRSGNQEPAVRVSEIAKRYPNMPVNAVDGVSFEVKPGEVFGLLGPNGAGKTTTVGILTTRVKPTSGQAFVSGIDVVGNPVSARGQLAVVPQRNNLDRSLSIRQNLLFHAAYHGIPARERAERADRLLEQFGLAERAGDKPDFFSGGQSQRIMIARALMHAPAVLFLDEPTTGLDPAARLFVWDRLQELADQGVTLLLTTHDMDEADALADRVGIMDHGKLLSLDTPAALKHALPGQRTLELAVTGESEDVDELIAALESIAGVESAEQVQIATADAMAGGMMPGGFPGGAPGGGTSGGAPGDMPANTGDLRLRMYVSGDAPSLVAPSAAILSERKLELTDIKLGEPSLEDVFIDLTGRALR